MRRERPVVSGIAWGRLQGRIVRTIADLLRSRPGDRRKIRVDLELDAQGTPTHGSVRAKGRVRPVGAVPLPLPLDKSRDVP